ncbi:hypothetical protein OHB54_46915 (plasmid) [Streptomyces sp. NBC_01007]|nr:hypothetical protein OHB54_46915 [Streptomyces sp. NBC_01007]
MTAAVEFVQLSMSCTASGWFLGVGVFFLIGAVGGLVSGEGLDEAAGCFGLALLLIVGGGLAGVGINSFVDGCH